MTTQPREKAIESYLKKQAERHNVLALKFISPTMSGVPDQILIGKTSDGHSRVIFVEVKRPCEKRRVLQHHVAQLILKHGGVVTAVDSEETVDALLDHCFGKQSQHDTNVPYTFIKKENTTKTKPRHTFSFPQP